MLQKNQSSMVCATSNLMMSFPISSLFRQNNARGATHLNVYTYYIYYTNIYIDSLSVAAIIVEDVESFTADFFLALKPYHSIAITLARFYSALCSRTCI